MTMGANGMPGLLARPTGEISPGKLLRVTVITTSGQFTPLPDTRWLVVDAQGGSGGGGFFRDILSSGGGGEGPTCFPAGTMVTLADGSLRAIERVTIGTKVLSKDGTVNTVIALDRPLLGHRRMYQVGRVQVSAEHRFWRTDGCFACPDPEAQKAEWGQTITHIGPDGLYEEVKPPMVHTPLDRLKPGDEVVTAYGTETLERVTPLPVFDWPPSTQLYNLVVDGSHTFFAEGYLVSGFARDDDWDYTAWKPRVRRKK